VGGTGDDDFRWNATSQFGDFITDFTAGSDDFVFDVSAGTIQIGDNDNTVENFEIGTILATDDGDQNDVVVINNDDIDGVGDLGVQGTIDLYNGNTTGTLFLFDVGSKLEMWYDPNPQTGGGAILVATITNISDIGVATFASTDFGFI
jgi:hypothetical protein